VSLVSEALRKARQEARLRDAAARGIPIEIVTRHVGGGRGPGSVVAVLAVVAAGVGGATLTWWLLAHRDQATVQPVAGATRRVESASPGSPQPASPAGSRPAAIPALPPVRSQSDATPGSSLAASSAAPPSSSSRLAEATVLPHPPANAVALLPRGADVAAGASGTTPAAGSQRAASATPPARPDAGRVQPAQADDRGRVGRDATNPAGERSFKIEARLGGVTLHLDYIVHRATSPFAGINGEQVLTGSMIRGFTVEEITPDAVRLSGPGGVVVLRTR